MKGKGKGAQGQAAAPDAADRNTNTSAHIQIIGLGLDVEDATPSVMLTFDRARYLFNVPEGFQRYCAENKLKAAKLGNILFTKVDASTSNGLPGFMLTVADSASSSGMPPVQLAVHGPPRIQGLMTAVETIVRDRHVVVTPRPFGDGPAGAWGAPVLDDDLVRVSGFVVDPADGAGQQGAKRSREADASGPSADRPEKLQRTSSDAPAAPAAGAGASADHAAATAGTSAADTEGDEAEWAAEAAAAAASAGSGGGGSGGGTGGRWEMEVGHQESVLYLGELRDIPGKFDPQKAAQLGLPKGPLFGKLVKGETVQTPDGRTVTPADVVSPSTLGPSVLIADIPSVAHLLSATSRPRPAPANGSGVTVAVHIVPREVATHPAFAEWVAGFGPNTTHLLASAAFVDQSSVFRSQAAMTTKLSLVHDSLFPPLPAPPAAAPLPLFPPGCGRMVPGGNLLRFGLRPVASQVVDVSAASPPVSADSILAEVAKSTPLALELAAAAAQARGQAKGSLEDVAAAAAGADAAADPAAAIPECIKRMLPSESPEIIFLGTGAAIPSKYRNVSAILLRVPSAGGGEGTLLMDCGEGTLGQLRRRLGPKAAEDAIRNLRIAWISHIHADHHVGLVSVLSARRALLGPSAPPLPVAGPWPLRKWLQAFDSNVQRLGFEFILLPETTAECVAKAAQGGGAGPHGARALAAVQRELGVSKMWSVPVVHCAHSYALAIEGPTAAPPPAIAGGGGDAGAGAGAGGCPPWKVVYSGDTRPCDQLVEAARNATVLIHEATFEDALESEALSKRHSLTREAVEVGSRAGAFRTLLTHFSQRYPKVPVVADIYCGRTGIAFDMMRVALTDLPHLPGTVPALRALLVEEEGAEEGIM